MNNLDNIIIVPNERAVFLREENMKLYRVSSYYFGRLAVDLPMFIMFPIFLFLLIHWTVGYNLDGGKTMIFSIFK